MMKKLLNEEPIFAPKGGKPGFIINGTWRPVDPRDLNSPGLNTVLQRYGQSRGTAQLNRDQQSLQPPSRPSQLPTPPVLPAPGSQAPPPAPAPTPPPDKWYISKALGGTAAFKAGGGLAALKADPMLSGREVQIRGMAALRAQQSGQDRYPSAPVLPPPSSGSGTSQPSQSSTPFVDPNVTASGERFERRTPKTAELKAAQDARYKAILAGLDYDERERRAVTAGIEKAKELKLKGGQQMEAFDIVLEYLASEGHVDTLDEALYVMMEMDCDTIQSICEAAKDQSDKQIEKGVKTTYKAGNVLDNQHQGRSRGLNRLPAGERAAKTERMRRRLKARRDDLFGERNRREDEKMAHYKKLLGL